jgi:hypothetical protein
MPAEPMPGQVPVGPCPYPDTHAPGGEPDPHPALLALLPFVGLWRGRGRGGYPTIDDFDYAQEVRISHDGRPFLAYEARAWLLDERSRPAQPSARESGWWRPVIRDGAATGEVEVLLSTPTGIMELYYGRVDGLKLEVATDAVMRTATAQEVTAAHRLYGIVDGELWYAHEMAAVGQRLSPHLSARLTRVGSGPVSPAPAAAAGH